MITVSLGLPGRVETSGICCQRYDPLIKARNPIACRLLNVSLKPEKLSSIGGPPVMCTMRMRSSANGFGQRQRHPCPALSKRLRPKPFLTEWSSNDCGFIMISKFPNGSECAGIFSDRIPVVLAPEKTLWERLLIARRSHKETADPRLAFASCKISEVTKTISIRLDRIWIRFHVL